MVTSSDIRIRISENQKAQIKNLAEASGHKTISDYVRSKIFDVDLGIHTKINKIIEILQEDKNERKGKRKPRR